MAGKDDLDLSFSRYDANEPALYDAMIAVRKILFEYGETHHKLDQ